MVGVMALLRAVSVLERCPLAPRMNMHVPCDCRTDLLELSTSFCMHAGPSGAELAAVVADHAFFQYERTLQREYNPELVINLPSPQSLPSTLGPDAGVRVSRLPYL